MSNYTKPVRPEGVPEWIYIGAEHVNGTGQTLLWAHHRECADAGGTIECCTAAAQCVYWTMPWQEMSAIGVWLIEQAGIARERQLEES